MGLKQRFWGLRFPLLLLNERREVSNFADENHEGKTCPFWSTKPASGTASQRPRGDRGLDRRFHGRTGLRMTSLAMIGTRVVHTDRPFAPDLS